MSKLPLYLLCAVLVAAAAVVTAESIESLPADAGLARGDRAAGGRIGRGPWHVDAAPDESLAEVDGKVPGVPLAWAKGRRPPEPPPGRPQPAEPPRLPDAHPARRGTARPAPGHTRNPRTAAPAAQAPPSAPPRPGTRARPAASPAPAPGVGLGQSAPQPTGESEQQRPTGDVAASPSAPSPRGGAQGAAQGKRATPTRTRLRNGDGSPARSNPGFVDALPGPSFRSGVPNFVIRKFRVPIFLLPIYQAAGIQYGVRWEVLAAINEIETDYGRNLNVSSAGALGWMQFIPSSWRAYGVDANKDGTQGPL